MFMAPTGAQKSEKPQFSFSDSAQTGITAHQFFVAHGFKSDLIKNIAAHGSDAHDLSFSEHAVLHPVAGLQILRFCGCRCRRFCLGSGAQNIAPGMMMASCGIAYVMRYIRAQMEGGVEMGFRPAEAQAIAMQTMKGAVALLENTGLHPEAAIDRVTTPGGVTIKGLNELDHSGFNSAVIRSLKAGLK